MTEPTEILAFWRDAGPDSWFRKSDAFDAKVAEYRDTWEAARDGKLVGWADTPDGRLALILVLDQFPRNLFRDDARAYSTDAAALLHTRAAIRGDEIDAMPADLNVFALMPLMHSESIVDQRDCVRLMQRPEWANNFKFAVVHRDVIERFGRFPHRNDVLGRTTTPAEQTFLDEGGFGG